MSLTAYEAAKSAREHGNTFTAGMLEEIVTQDQLFQLVKFVLKPGNGFSYEREKSIGSFNFIAAGATVAESSATSDTVVVPKREAVSDFDIANSATHNLGDQLSAQLRAKLKAAGRHLAEKFILGAYATGHTFGAGGITTSIVTAMTYGPGLDSVWQGPASLKYTHSGTLWQFRAPGDVAYGPTVAVAADATVTLVSDNPSKHIAVTVDVSAIIANAEVSLAFTSSSNDPDGLYTLIESGQNRLAAGANGDALSFAILDELIDSVDVTADQAVMFMSKAMRRKYNILVRASGGTTPDHIFTMPNGKQVTAYHGIPILTNDFIPNDEVKGSGSTLSSVMLASLDDTSGFYIGTNGGQSFNLDLAPMGATVFGFQFYQVGNLETKNTTRHRLAWYGAPALGSTKAAARASQIITA